MELEFLVDNWISQDLSFEQQLTWYKQLIDAEGDAGNKGS